MPSAPTLVLVPGMACDERLWEPQLTALQAAGPTVVSTPHLSPLAPTDLAGMARKLLAEHAGPLALAGCSMGAMIALQAWRLAPDRIRGLALMGTSARPDTDELRRLRTEACALFAAGRMAEVLRANVLFAFHPDHGPRWADRYLAMVQAGGAQALVHQNRVLMAREDLRPVLPTVRCPVLVVGGEDDALTPPERLQEIAEAIPGATLAWLPRCGHMLTWEQPDAVTRLLLDWRARWA